MTDSCWRGLDALRDDRRLPLRGELLQGPEDGVRRILADAALHERQVDLDDVEVDLAEQPEPGVARADVVRGEAHPGPAAGLDVPPELLEVLDLLSLGELQHDPVERDAVGLEDRLESPTRNWLDSSVRGERLTLRYTSRSGIRAPAATVSRQARSSSTVRSAASAAPKRELASPNNAPPVGRTSASKPITRPVAIEKIGW